MTNEENLSNLGELSRILILGEGSLYINKVKKLLLATPPDKLSSFILIGDVFLFKSVVYYIRLFKKDPQMTTLINHPEFSIEALERIIIYLHFQYSIRDMAIEDIFPEQLPPIEKNRILELLIQAKHIQNDYRIIMNLMSQLDRDMLERYIKEQENPVSYLGNMIRYIPEQTLKDFLYRNSDLYGYLKLFFVYSPEADQEIADTLMSYEQDIEEAMRTLIFAKKLKENKAKFPIKKHDTERISTIINQLRIMDDPEKSMNLLANQGAFLDETEYTIVKNILLNPQFSDILASVPSFSNNDLKLFLESDLHFF